MFFFRKILIKPKLRFCFSTNNNFFYPKKVLTYINGRCCLSNLPIDLMRNSFITMNCLQGALLIASSLYIMRKYQKASILSMGFAIGISLWSLSFLIRSSKKMKFFLFKIELAEDGKHIYLTKVNRFFKFTEEKVGIERIKPALDFAPKKFSKIGKPLMIDSTVFLFPNAPQKGGYEVDEDKKEIFEAIFKGKYIFVGEENVDIRDNENFNIKIKKET